MNLVELKLGEFVSFDWRDKTPGGSNLGRAEFEICQIYKRGKLKEVFIYPRQQRTDKYYHATMNGDNSFHIASYEELENANVWLTYPCKEHKTITIRLYVPRESRFFSIEYSGMIFSKTDWNRA